VQVSWQSPNGVMTEFTRVGWPAAWVSMSREVEVMTPERRSAVPRGLSMLAGAAAYRWIDDEGHVRRCVVNLMSVATTLMPIVLAAGAPLVLWRLVARRKGRQRKLASECVACGYPLA
jgi:hypothetical protein